MYVLLCVLIEGEQYEENHADNSNVQHEDIGL